MRLSHLAGALRKHGLTVVETPGWASRGFAGRDLKEVRGVLWHHTATNRARFNGADAPTLGMCIEGRPDVAGPLCNIVFGRNGTVYLVAAGLANHAGAGVAPNIPRDMGNYYLIGIEMESSGVAPWDWTPEQLRVAPYLGAALEVECLGGLPPELRLQIGHLEYSSQGKIDPAGWPGGMDGLRSAINAVLNGAAAITEEDDMDPNARIFKSKDGIPVTLNEILNSVDSKVDGFPLFDRQVRADLASKGAQIAALSAAVTALSEKKDDVSTAEVLAAVEAGVEKFTASYRLSLERVEEPPAGGAVDG